MTGAPGPDDPARVIAFGPFTADLRTRELHKQGSRVRLPGMPFEVLAALLERPGDLVTRDELRQRLWSADTFVDFDNNLNTAVARLRQVLGDSAEAPRFVETLPKLGYRFVGQVESRPSTPEPAAAPSAGPSDAASPPIASVPSGHEPTARSSTGGSWTAGRLIGLAVLAAVLAGSTFWAWRVAFRPTMPAGRVVVVVLPFENLTGDEAQAYLADGITEETITELARVAPDRLGVIARTTSFRLRDRALGAAEVARAVAATHVLEGSIRRSEATVRITAQLIEPAGETHVWAQTYDRPLGDLLAVEREIAAAVARAVSVAVSPAPAAASGSTQRPDARDAFLRARHLAAIGSVQAVTQAIAAYEEATRLDPSYALAYAGLSRVLVFATRIEPAIALDRARAAAARALEIAPNLPEAQLAMAITRLYRDRDLAGAERDLRQTVGADPGSADAHFYYSQVLTARGRFDEALREARLALSLDPFALLVHHYVGRILSFAGRPAEAEAHLQTTLALDPNYGWALLFLALAQEEQGHLAAAVETRQRYWATMGEPADQVAGLGRTFEQGGYAAVRRAWIAWIGGFVRQSGYVTSSELALLHAALGEKDEAYRWLEKAREDHTRDLIYARVYREFVPFRNADPRFAALIDRIVAP